MSSSSTAATIAIFLDLENLVLRAKEADLRFDIRKVLKTLASKGRVVFRRAYSDFSGFDHQKHDLHEQAFELIEVPHRGASGKNSADIRLIVDALDLSFRNPLVDTFVILSGDSDFIPAVNKLREYGKTVVGIGVKKNSSKRLVSACDEFWFYDDLVEKSASAPSAQPATAPAATMEAPAAPSAPAKAAKAKAAPTKKAAKPKATPPPPGLEVFDPLLAACRHLHESEASTEEFVASRIKGAMTQHHPNFAEKSHGFSSFSKYLEAARDRGLVVLKKKSKGGYSVRLKASAA